jgi:hypothetical protein
MSRRIATIKAEFLPAVCEALANRQIFNVAKQNERFERVQKTQLPANYARPLMEDGQEFGRVEARIPRAAFFQLLQQKNFGYEGMMSDEGMRDLLKAFPQCRVQTVSGKLVVGVGGVPRKTVKKYA